MDVDTVGRLALAALCVMVLVGARWRHERQLAGGLAQRKFAVPLHRARSTRRVPLGGLSQSLYWLGLTSSAALAAQAIASLVSRLAR